MRYVAIGLVLAFWCAAAYGQNLGWARCGYTDPSEKMMLSRVALLKGSEHERYQTLDTPAELAVGVHVIEFNALKVETTFTGMLISCQVKVPGTKWTKVTTEIQWEQPIALKAGTAPKLGVLIEEPTPGTLMLNIGKK